MDLRGVRDRVLSAPGVTPAIQSLVARGAVPRKVWQRLQPLGVATVRPMTGGQFQYRSTAGDAMARHVVWNHLRAWEETTQPVLAELASKARVFVDAGAYTGVYTLLATGVNPNLRVVAFEANPETADLLSANLELNGLQDRVQVVREALADAPGSADFFIDDDPTASGLSGTGRRITVPLIPADAHLEGLDVDLVKMDVEGHEPAALRGMARTLGRCHPPVIVECLTAGALADVQAVLVPLGYSRCTYLGPDGPVKVAGTVDPLPRYANFLFEAAS